MTRQYVSWIRVSTKKQGDSGLGLEAQQELIRASMGGEPVMEYKDVYTGTHLEKCVELRKAINYTKANGLLLVVAKCDRFRDDIQALQILDEVGEENIKFCDAPGSSRLILGIMFGVYRHQAMIGRINTKIALRQIKKKLEAGEKHVSKKSGNTVAALGRKPGSKSVPQSAVQKSAAKDRIGSDPTRRRQWLLMKDLHGRGDSIANIASTLNATGETTPKGTPWTKGAVYNAIKNWGVYFID
jgi:hypothetical protein